jgi:predicted DCC family thiol-disulfide oxidoreductase YuxK
MAMWRVKLLYDGACPFCRREVAWLKRRDRYGTLATEDISDPAFDAARYGITRHEAMGALHAVLADGRVVRGMDAVREAYRAIGLGWVVAPTRLPVVSAICDHFYSTFARNRARLGRLVTGRLGRHGTRCACVVADRPSQGKLATTARESAGRNWVQDARRQPCFPLKKTIQRRGFTAASPRGCGKPAK